MSELVVEEELAHIVLHHERSAAPPPTGAVIDSLIGLLTLARMATKRQVVPLAITLRHPTPRHPDTYRAAFGCPITFDAPRDRMTLARADLDLPHPDASRTLLGIVYLAVVAIAAVLAARSLRRMPASDRVAS